MLSGNWKNFEELEETITLSELEQIVLALRKKEHRQNKFAAALKNIDIGDYGDSSNETVEEVMHRAQVRAAARLNDMDPAEYELKSLGFGID